MEFLKKVLGYFKNEIKLNKEYYEGLEENTEEIMEDDSDDVLGKRFHKPNEQLPELYEEAINIIFQCGQASASLLQRYLKISFNNALEILNHFEACGIVGGFNVSTPRKIFADSASHAKKMLEESSRGTKNAVNNCGSLVVQDQENTYTIYFAYGHVAKVFPQFSGSYYENRNIINAATSIVSDGVPYDLTDIESIHSIQIPNYHIYASNKIGEELGITGFLEYVLRMHASLCWNKGDMNIAIACLEKATQLMKYSTMNWPVEDFYRIVNWLNDLGKFRSANNWREWITKNVPWARSILSSSMEDKMEEEAKRSFRSRISSCKELGTDLIEIGDIGACCAKCAMYRKRVYSLTGKNKLFPRFPNDYHWGCGLSGWPYIYGISEPSFECDDVIKYSNRPYLDDRTQEEKRNYVERMAKLNSTTPVIREPDLNRIIYYRIKQLIPDDAPKSLSGFSRMRNANTKNYQTLVKKAEAAGFVFPQTLDDVSNWPENQ